MARMARARSSTAGRSQPRILPENPAAFAAKASEPPINPVPIMVICLKDMFPEMEPSLAGPGPKCIHTLVRRKAQPFQGIVKAILNELAPNRGSNHAKLAHELGKLLRIQRLRA